MLLSILLFVIQVVALATRPPADDTARLMINYARPTPTESSTSRTEALDARETSLTSAQVTMSALVTIAPLSRNPLELRQKCFDDQGFSVDCATWTGYYYTWGGAGHPYAGGPGDDGGGGGNSGNGFHYVGTATKPTVPLIYITSVVLLTCIWLIRT